MESKNRKYKADIRYRFIENTYRLQKKRINNTYNRYNKLLI